MPQVTSNVMRAALFPLGTCYKRRSQDKHTSPKDGSRYPT